MSLSSFETWRVLWVWSKRFAIFSSPCVLSGGTFTLGQDASLAFYLGDAARKPLVERFLELAEARGAFGIPAE